MIKLRLMNNPAKRAKAAITLGISGFPLWVLSYAWIPFDRAGMEMGPWILLVIVGEVSAMLVGITALVLSIAGLKGSLSGSTEHRLARRGLVIAVGLLLLVIIPNILGALFFTR